MKLIEKLNEFKVYSNNTKRRLYLFLCPICKQYAKKVYAHGLKQKSCGCKLHGLSNTRIHGIWSGMLSRCSDKAVGEIAKNYHCRGIRVCKEWVDFISFYNWAINNGYEEHLQIDRKDNNDNYTPKNCRWVTQEINNQNSRQCKLNERTAKQIIILKNKGIDYKDISEIYNIHRTTISKIGRISWVNLREKLL